MSSSNPPNPNTPPVFNNDAFGLGANPNIDTAYLNANYLRFPTAQGAETLQNIQVIGSSTFTQLPTCSVVPSSSSQLVNKAYVDALPPPTADNLTAVLTAGDDAGGLNITNLNELTTTGTTNFGGASNNFNTAGINQTDSSFINTNTSTLSYTQIGGGTIGVADGTATAVVDINNTTIGITDTSAGTDHLILTKNSITYTNDTANGQQLIISSTNNLSLNIEATTGIVLNTGTGDLTSLATQPISSDSSTKIPTTAWVQSAIGAVGILGLNNTFTGFNAFDNTNEGSLTSLATQPAYNDSSTKIPTTAWVQGLIGQFLNPITTETSTAEQIYPPTALHLYATGYIIGKGGLAGDPSTPDFAPWGMGGAGGGAGGVSFSFQLQNNIQYVYFGLNYTSAGYSSLSVNSTTPSPTNTMAIANVGGIGADDMVGGAGGTGGSGTFTALAVSGLISSSGTVSNGTNGTAGTSGQTGSTLVFPTGGTNALNASYGFGQSHPELDGYNTSGYINYPASPISDPRCLITWSVSPP